ncbi:MAG TPA: TaqI-like C-terminal specificity domain-containing protein, partial [Chitinophagales bacterium]|nr:TaqI-like C-terminal specificity domain-containing protein [Chitinophagales bacterium]
DSLQVYITSSNAPYGLHRARQSDYFENPKIIFKGMFVSPEFCIDFDKYYFGLSFSSVIQKDDNYSLKYLLAILNSKFAKEWFYNNGKLRGAGVDIGVEKLRTFPVPTCKHQNYFDRIVDYIIFLKSQNFENPSDQLMPTYFEQIIDGTVYELYFPELIKKHKREIIQHLGELPEFTDKMSLPAGKADDEQKMKICKTVFNRLNDREHPVRVNLFYMSSIPEIRIIEGKTENN